MLNTGRSDTITCFSRAAFPTSLVDDVFHSSTVNLLIQAARAVKMS